jgi:uncharacterized protein YecE (DUF72 family)
MSRVHIGTMGWSYRFWIGNFYPKDLGAEEFLTECSKYFNTVEVDSTFYRVPYESTVTKWKSQTPADFLFSAKFPKTVTHVKMLENCENEVEGFIRRVSQLQNKLGPLLLQFPATFRLEHLHLLNDFLPSLPKRHHYVVEVRNKELLEERFYSLLRENGVALAFLDRSSMPKIEELTADFVYIRWEGDRRKVSGTLGKVEVDRTIDFKQWATRIRSLLDLTTDIFGYFSKYYSGHPPTDAKQLLNLLQPSPKN